jgi:hypothetical protein
MADDNAQVQLGKSFYTTRDPKSFPVRQATPDELQTQILPRIKKQQPARATTRLKDM